MTDPVKRRVYRSSVRAERAHLTRRRILAAATELFLGDGYAVTTIPAVAARASVAADTVLHVFGSKRGLLKAAMDVIIGGDDDDVALLDRAGPQAVAREPDQRRQIAMFARGMTVQLERVRPANDMLRSAAAVDAECASLWADLHLRQRRLAMRTLAGWIAAHGPLRSTVGVDHAAAVLWTVASPEVHRMLRIDSGWSEEAYRAWLERTLVAELLPR